MTVIAVTGSGQKKITVSDTLTAQTELGGEISLLKQGLAAILRLLFFVPATYQTTLPPTSAGSLGILGAPKICLWLQSENEFRIS